MSEIFQNRSRKEFFKESSELLDEDDSPLSLRSYLSKRIFQNLKKDPQAKKLDFIPKPGQSQEVDENALNGNQLNSLDTEMSAGLEQYLPTPAVRLRITRERLGVEIAELREQLKHYEALKNPPPDVARKLEGLKTRLETLEQHEKQIEEELSLLFRQSSVIFQIATALEDIKNRLEQTAGKVAQQFSPMEILHKVDPQRYELVTLNQQLQSLTEVMEDHLASSKSSSTELGSLINQYDQTVRQVEQLAETLRNKKGLWDKLNDKVTGLYRRLYS